MAKSSVLEIASSQVEGIDDESLDLVFQALSDPVRRTILARLDDNDLLVSQLAAPFDISLQAVSKHIQVLVKAGLVTQQRSGRINRCRLSAGPIYNAAIWINQYSKYWQTQFDVLAAALGDLDEEKSGDAGGAASAPGVGGAGDADGAGDSGDTGSAQGGGQNTESKRRLSGADQSNAVRLRGKASKKPGKKTRAAAKTKPLRALKSGKGRSKRNQK